MMMRISTLILFISLLNRSAYAAPASQKNTLANPEPVTYANIDRLNNICSNIFLTYPDSAHKIADTALILSEKLNYSFGKGRSFLNLGIIYWSQSYYPVSLFYLKSAITFLPKDRPLYLSDAYRALGRTYADLKDYKQALINLDTASYFAGNNAARLAEVYSERTYIYNLTGDYDKALGFVKYSLKLNRIAKAEDHIAVLYGRMASIYLAEKNYRAAIAYNDTAAFMSIKIHNKRLLAYTYTDYALACNGLGQYAKAVDYAKKGITLSDSLGLMDAETKAFNALVTTYELKHDYLTALGYQKRFNIIKDSLTNIAKLKTVKLVQNYYDLNAKMNQLTIMSVNAKLNEAKIRSQHIIIRMLLFSMVILLAILTGTYYFYKQKILLGNKLQVQHKELLEQKKLIEEQSANLQKVNDLKDKLFAVIGHDLRSPIANLSNITEMFDEGYLTPEEVHDLMKNINPIIKGVGLTLSNLIEWAGSQIKGHNLTLSNVDIFLMGVEMEQTFIHALQVKNIEFVNKAYPGQGAVADENHLKVILRNLISNAIKFTSDKGTIKLSTTIENNGLIVSVTDSGKGMSAEELDKLFYLNTHFSNSGTSGEKGTGIGLLLCKELVELNGGILKVKSKLGAGSTFYFNLPLAKSYV
ncbi:tetratricopeptide repeat-containing sensor histidine kinase [Mucilaginibacter sp.]|uniref:tetratricopeptide repeat-containing sensor histidine kinase n=1 Tax=Mucilaginibacter sp. TaxID=1882438 RepID=UPI00283EDFD8|nr:tetratricopeptide repeat-containing sensor histidine kinase [Mucilaginibacter sp.]MDR3697355.1 tetratricopeptide repeat-containing sensor histidine kinase [Mucilaginibacter sp.]